MGVEISYLRKCLHKEIGRVGAILDEARKNPPQDEMLTIERACREMGEVAATIDLEMARLALELGDRDGIRVALDKLRKRFKT